MELEAKRLQRLIDLGRSLVSELDYETVLQRLLDGVRDLTGARYAALGILDETRTGLENFIVSGIDDAVRHQIGDLPRGHGVLGVLITDPRPLRLRNVGDHPRSFGFPPGHPPMSSFLGVPVTISGRVYGNLYLTEKDSGEFTEQDEQALVILADWAAIAIDNARVHRAVRGRRDELERAVRGFEATTDLARALGAEVELEHVLDLIAKRARALVGARTAVVLLRDEENMLGVVAVAGERGESPLSELRLPIEGTFAGEVFSTLRTRRAPTAREDMPVALALGATAQVAAPLVFRGQSLGVLAAYADEPFVLEDARVLSDFAASAASAIATAQSVATRTLRLAIEAAEQERRRWARELHDETLQQLGGLRMLLSSARRRGGEEALRSAIDEAVELLADGIAELRALITDLRPAALDQLGTEAALEALVERTRRLTGLDVELVVDLDWEQGRAATRHEPQLESTTYRVVQEALTNITRHSGATRATVRVSEDGDTLTVVITDDGAGFDTSTDKSGFGLVGMNERAALVGGRVDIESAPGEGTTVRAVFPVRRAEPAVA